MIDHADKHFLKGPAMKLEFPKSHKVKKVHTLADAVIAFCRFCAQPVASFGNQLGNFFVYLWHGHRVWNAFKMAFGIN